MTVMQVEIEDQLIQEVGAETIKTFMERQLAFLRLQYLGQKISTALQQAGVEQKSEIEAARQEAWEEYKTTYLRDRL
jgi:hypothetical protein